MNSSLRSLIVALALSTTSVFAAGKTPPPKQNHVCMKDGVVVEKTKKVCLKEGGLWQKLPAKPADDKPADPPAPKAE